MNIHWDYFVNPYDMSRYIATSDGRDNQHIQFVREFASVVSVLQVRWTPFSLIFPSILTMANLGQNEQCHRFVQGYFCKWLRVLQPAHIHQKPLWTRFRVLCVTELPLPFHGFFINVWIILGQIDQLNLEGYANLDYWVAELDKCIEGILLQWLTQIIQVWCSEFDGRR